MFSQFAKGVHSHRSLIFYEKGIFTHDSSTPTAGVQEHTDCYQSRHYSHWEMVCLWRQFLRKLLRSWATWGRASPIDKPDFTLLRPMDAAWRHPHTFWAHSCWCYGAGLHWHDENPGDDAFTNGLGGQWFQMDHESNSRLAAPNF